MPELLWKAYIDFETEEGERDKARSLYERLLALSGHVKVWISFALFEATPLPLPRGQRDEEDGESDEALMVPGDLDTARQVFERGYRDLKDRGLKPEVRTSLFVVYEPWLTRCPLAQRVALLESWKAFEESNGTEEDVAKVQSMFPIVSRKRKVDESGQAVEGKFGIYFLIWF